MDFDISNLLCLLTRILPTFPADGAILSIALDIGSKSSGRPCFVRKRSYVSCSRKKISQARNTSPFSTLSSTLSRKGRTVVSAETSSKRPTPNDKTVGYCHLAAASSFREKSAREDCEYSWLGKPKQKFTVLLAQPALVVRRLSHCVSSINTLSWSNRR